MVLVCFSLKQQNLWLQLIIQGNVFNRRMHRFIFPPTPGDDVQWNQKSFHDSCTTPHVRIKSSQFAGWRRPFYVWCTSLTECKLSSWIPPCWEHGAIINVDHSIEDAGQGRGERESVKRPGIVRPGWGVGKRNVGRTWAVRGLRERHHCPLQLPPQPDQGEGGMRSRLLLLCMDPKHRQSHAEACKQLTTNTICSLIKTFLLLDIAIVPPAQGGKRQIDPVWAGIKETVFSWWVSSFHWSPSYSFIWDTSF